LVAAEQKRLGLGQSLSNLNIYAVGGTRVGGDHRPQNVLHMFY
jgi:hypothetical protein